MLESVNPDIICYIFSLVKPQPSHFLINKKIYKLSKDYLTMHMTKILNVKLPPYREYATQCLFHYYQCNLIKDIGNYRKYILYFISNKTRKSAIYPCVNSYHRMLVHRFCDAQGLLHKTIIKGTKKVRTCRVCVSPNIIIL